jgi:hypothetical protein
VLNLINDSTTTQRSVIEMTNSNLTKGFQIVNDEGATGVNSLVIYDIAAKANRVFIDPSGDVGINTVNPRFGLEVNGITAVDGGGFSYPNTENAFAIGWDNVQPGDGITELVNYQGTGNAGPCFELFRVPNVGTPSTANVIAIITESGVYQSSDKRLKTDIQPLHYGLREVMALKPMEYDFHLGKSVKRGIVDLEEEKSHQLGFIAQDAYRIVPEAVEKPKDEATDLYRMNYAGLVPVLVSAVQELKHLQDETVAAQQAKITQQETKIASLEAELASLKEANGKLAAIASKLETLEKAVNNPQIKDSTKEQTVAINGDH